MTSYLRWMFFVILCLNMTACLREWQIYTHPSIPDADASEVSIFEDVFKLRRILDADGNEIHYMDALPPTEYPPRVEIRLPPGDYHIYYQDHFPGWASVSGNGRVTLEAGHRYKVESEFCSGSIWLLDAFCLTRMDHTSGDAWIEDMTTGERVAGCRQGLGCLPDSHTRRYKRGG